MAAGTVALARGLSPLYGLRPSDAKKGVWPCDEWDLCAAQIQFCQVVSLSSPRATAHLDRTIESTVHRTVLHAVLVYLVNEGLGH